MTGHHGCQDERGLAEQHEHRTVPPGHRDGPFVLFLDEMIRLVGLEDLVMDQGMGLEGIIEGSQWLVHDKPVKGPFEKGRPDNGAGKTKGRPKQESTHDFLILCLEPPGNDKGKCGK